MSPNWISFPKLNISFEIDPTAFTIGTFEVRWYGVIIAAGMLLAMIYCFRRMEKFGLSSDRVIDAVIAGVIGGIIGARAYYIIFSDTVTFADFFKIREGGLAIYGGIIGALLFGGICAKIRKVKLFPLFDIASIGFIIGQGVGRWANFINQEAFGSQTDLPWGMAGYNIQIELGGSKDGAILMAHPCFLYESLWCVVCFVLLHFISKKRKFDGQVFLSYVALYGLGRFFIEGLRTDSLMLGRLRVSQVLAAFCVVVALVIMLAAFSKIKRSGVPAVLYVDTDESKEILAADAEAAKKEEEKRTARKAAREEKTEEKSADDKEDEKENTEDDNNGKDN